MNEAIGLLDRILALLPALPAFLRAVIAVFVAIELYRMARARRADATTLAYLAGALWLTK